MSRSVAAAAVLVAAGLPGLNAGPGDLIWKLPLAGENTGEPALGRDGTVYVGSWVTNVLYAVNPEGALRWTFDAGPLGVGYGLPYPIVGPDDTVFATSWDGHVIALRPDGSLKWRQRLEQRLWDPPAVGVDGTLYVSSQRHEFASDPDLLTVLGADGLPRWQTAVGGATPILAGDGVILMATRWGSCVWLNPDGAVRASHST